MLRHVRRRKLQARRENEVIFVFFDTHCHLDMMDENELKNSLENAKTAGVGKIISCSTSFASNEKNLLISQNNPQVKAAIGLYPLDALELNETELSKSFDFFKTHINKVIGIGEVGLDHKYTKIEEDKLKQEKILTKFISLSKEFDKPLIIHSRFAQRQVLELLEKENAKKVLLHSFVDSSKLMKKAIEEGYFISVGMSVILNEEVQKRIKEFPLDHLLFETDSPIRFGGEKALSEHIPKIAQKVAELKGISLNEVEIAQEKNFYALFGKK